MRCRTIVLTQQVSTEITFKVPPNRMNVVRVVLCVVILNQKCRPLHPVVMRVANGGPACPSEVKLIKSCSFQFLTLLRRDIIRHPEQVFLYELFHLLFLYACHTRCRNPFGIEWI